MYKPNPMLQQLFARNKDMREVMELVNKAGGDPKTAFYQLAQAKGVDPEAILSMIRK